MAVFHSFLVFTILLQAVHALSCGSCNKALCHKPINCKAGLVKGVCGCCNVCAKSLNEECGGLWNIHGQCGKEFTCVTRNRMQNQNDFLPEHFQTGICEPDVCGQKECGFREICKVNKRGKPVCKCPRKCGRRGEPVCGLLDGKQYRNKCKLSREECLTKKEIGFVTGRCKKCMYKGKIYKFGDKRPDVKPCERCICRHGSWSCDMKSNCPVLEDGIPNYSDGQPSCLMTKDGKNVVLPCPNGFSCRLLTSDRKLDVARVGICKKKKSYKTMKYKVLEIVHDLNRVLPKEKDKQQGEKIIAKSLPTHAKSERQSAAQIFPTDRNIDIGSKTVQEMDMLKKQQLKGGLINNVCLAPADKGTCWPAGFVRWFYNATSKNCEQFKYSGCGGNFNKFVTKQKCQEVCHSEHDFNPLIATPSLPSSKEYIRTALSEDHSMDILKNMCHDIKTGMSYHDGEKWNVDKCTSCSCERGQALCIGATCHVTCSKPIHVEGKCCPICESDLKHLGKAVDSIGTRCQDAETNMWYHSGERWNKNDCMNCSCFEGETTCVVPVCSEPSCEHPVKKEDVCCPVCPDDKKQAPSPTTKMSVRCQDSNIGKFYVPGDAWNVNDCVSCFCGEDGRSVCHEMQCREPNCSSPLHLQGRCCSVCPESFVTACTYDKNQYFQGDFMLLGDMCTLCKCNGKSWKCTKKYCNRTVNVVDSDSTSQPEKSDISEEAHSAKPNNEESDEFIVEDPIRMLWRGTLKPTKMTKKFDVSGKINNITLPTSTRTNSESHGAEKITETTAKEGILAEEPFLGATKKPEASPQAYRPLNDYKNKMRPSVYKNVDNTPETQNYTTVYGMRRL